MTNELVPMKVKHSILDLRVRAGLSQMDAANKLGISGATLRKWENDSSILPYKDMLRISNLYDVPLDYIFFGPNNAFSEKQTYQQESLYAGIHELQATQDK